VNAAFLIMSSAALAGADPAPPPPLPAAPVVVSGAGCSSCGTPAYSSGCCGSSKQGLFDKLKGRFGGFGKKSHGCGCAPACAPPAPACAPAPCNTCNAWNSCPTSIASRSNLFDTLKSRWGHKKKHGPCCDTCGAATAVDGCAAPLPVGAPPVVVPGPTAPPKEMPKPKETVKPKGNVSAPLPPVSGAGLTGPSPY
jgi:hypothetical protein